MFQLISIHKELIYSDEKEHVIYGEAILGRKREAVFLHMSNIKKCQPRSIVNAKKKELKF